MTNLVKKFNKSVLVAVFVSFFFCPIFAQSEHEGDWFSADTLSSVVKLSSLLVTYDVEGLPDDYRYHTKGGNPDFGDANVVYEEANLTHVGTGVVISKEGMIISNAHVTRAYIEPSIRLLKGDKVGPHGKPIKRVVVNPFTNVMFVGHSDTQRLEEKGDDSQKLQYVAFILEDDKDYNNYRDRAVLQVLYTCHLGDNGVPVVDDKNVNLDIPYAKLGNPFKTSFVDRKVRAMGFPGTGDPNRSARTVGELLGYEDEKTSRILHTSYISGGNSGGGLFHKDSLIGINTWDKLQDKSRPVAVAQPITYWFDMLTKVKWIYPKFNLPDGLILDWIDDDPGKESYKNEVQALFKIVSESDNNVPVTSGKLYAHRVDTEIDEVFTYMSIAKELDEAAMISYWLQYYTVEDFAKESGFNKDYVEKFCSVTDVKQLRDMLKIQHKSYFDEWYAGTFYCKCVDLDVDTGKAMLSVPKNSKIHITYVSADEKTHTTFTLTAGSDYIQGPFTLGVGQ
ncbi:MAG: trypsin-like peptidase domain-containing protein [Treponema sp.]|nr:trypsin-like peptidase domain-containing protein [Treponema sp.]